MGSASKRYILLLLVITALVSVQAQDITKGSIGGVVRDASGAVVPNITVRLSSPYGEHVTKTNNAGEFVFPNLVVGSGYILTVEQSGFATAKVTNLNVGVNQRTTTDITLTVSTTSQTVDVVSEGTATIDLVTTTIGANI